MMIQNMSSTSSNTIPSIIIDDNHTDDRTTTTTTCTTSIGAVVQPTVPSPITIPSTTLPTIITVPSYQPIQDASYIKESLSNIITNRNVPLLHIEMEIIKNHEPINNNNNNTPVVVSVWILQLNTMIIFIQQQYKEDSTNSSYNNNYSSSNYNSCFWMISNYSIYQEIVNVFQNDTNQHNKNNSSYGTSITIPLPSGCSHIICFNINNNNNNNNQSLLLLSDVQVRQQIVQKHIIPSISYTKEDCDHDHDENNLTDVPLHQQPQHQQDEEEVNDNTVNHTRIVNRDQEEALPSTSPSTQQQTSPSLPIFPSLDAKILTTTTITSSTAKYVPLQLNARQPIPFETDLFRGQMIMIVRPPPPTTTPSNSNNTTQQQDPYWTERIFSKKKRRCIITIQGQFKSVPKGIVYAGAEISHPMRLGLVTKGVCSILLKLVERFNSNIHSSFGTTSVDEDDVNDSSAHGTEGKNNSTQQKELAHIVAPAYTFFERFVVTKNGEVPPNIINDIEINESVESLQQRKKCTSIQSIPQNIYNTSDTYTFSFYSMYIDLPTWQIVGIPASGDIQLQTFWNQSKLRICMYDQVSTSTNNNTKHHNVYDNRYAFSVQLEYLGKNGEKRKKEILQEQQQMIAISESPTNSPIISNKKNNVDNVFIYDDSNSESIKSNIFTTDRRLRNALLQQQQETSMFPAVKRSESQLFILQESNSYDDSHDGSNDNVNNSVDYYEDEDLLFYDAKESFHSLINDDSNNVEVGGSSHVQARRTDNFFIKTLSIIDQYCPYWIDLCIPSKYGGSIQYVTAFACCYGKSNNSMRVSFRSESDCTDLLNSKIELNGISKTIAEIIDSGSVMNQFSSRLSSKEKLRRYIGMVLSDEYGTILSSSKIITSFQERMESNSTSETEFLLISKVKPSISNDVRFVRLSSLVARAYCDRHWVEEMICLHEKHITFRHLEKRKNSEFVLMLSNIINVTILPPDMHPCNNKYPILAVSTIARTIYLMFSSRSDLDIWVEVIDPQKNNKSNQQSVLEVKNTSSDGNSSKIFESYGAAADDFFHKSSIWNCKNRRLLNCGTYHFRVDEISVTSSNPLSIAENSLRAATILSKNGVDNCTEEHFRYFISCAADLKQAYVSDLDDKSRLAFYLNVYHTMISHAYLVFGPPDSSLKWINYFNNIGYQVGDDIFSLTELEHSIIRANMSYPTQFFSRFVIPKSSYPSLALKISDYRINFALNCGSQSNPSKIMMYQPDNLHEQLDAASRLYLLRSVMYRRTGSGDLEIKLPRICQWFSDDFGTTRSDLLLALEPYLPTELQLQLADCRSTSKSGSTQFDMSSIVIRYHSYNFECRPLSIM